MQEPRAAKGTLSNWRTLPAALYVLAILLVFGALCLGVDHHPKRSDAALTAGLLASLAAFSVLLASDRLTGGRAARLLVCYLPFAAVWLLSLLSPFPSRQSILYGSSQLLAWLGALALVVPACVLLFVLVKGLSPERLAQGIRRHWAISTVVLVFLLLCVETLTQWGTTDSFDYALSAHWAMEWNFSLESPSLFQLASHTSYMMALWYMAGAFMAPGDVVGLHFVNIALVASSVVCFYRIVLHFAPRGASGRSRLVAALLTCVYACNPMVLGMTYELSLDVLLMVSLVWFCAAYLSRSPVLVMFSAFSLVFSKEPGFVLLAGFVGVSLVLALAKGLARARGRGAAADPSPDRPGSLACALLALAASGVSLRFFPIWAVTSPDNPTFNTLLFDPGHVHVVLKQILVLNFAWLLAGVALVGIVVCLVACFVRWLLSRSRRMRAGADGGAGGGEGRRGSLLTLLAPFGAFCAFALFSVLYFTYANPRYVAPLVPLLSLFAVAPLCRLLGERRLPAVLAAALLCAPLLVQNVVTIDPLTLASFRQVDIGKTFLVTAEPDSTIEVGTPTAYNRQQGYMGTAFERMLAEISYDNDTMVLVDAFYGGGTYYQFSVRPNRNAATPLHYDPESGRVLALHDAERYSDAPLAPLNLRVVPQGERVDLSAYRGYGRVFFVTATWNDDFATCLPIEGLPVLEEGVAGFRYWQFEYYRVK
jgi:hypothetical protein